MSPKSPGETMPKENDARPNGHVENNKTNALSGVLASHRLSKFPIAMVILVAVIVIGLIGFAGSIFTKAQNSDLIEISGRIEAPETHISAIANTRVKDVLVNEGDRITKGQLLVMLDTGVINAKVGNVQQAIAQASQATRQADLHAAAVGSQVDEAKKKSRGFWTRVFTSPKGRAKEGEKLRGEMLQARMLQMQAHGALAKAKAMSSAAKSAKSNFNITSPIEGVVETRSIEPGELVATGQVMLTILDEQGVYMKGYIPEGEIGKIKLGQQANVFLDSDSTKAHSAHITAIDSSPSFTPENVYFKDDRVRQVFGVKLSLDNPDGLAKPGMSAEAKIKMGQSK